MLRLKQLRISAIEGPDLSPGAFLGHFWDTFIPNITKNDNTLQKNMPPNHLESFVVLCCEESWFSVSL